MDTVSSQLFLSNGTKCDICSSIDLPLMVSLRTHLTYCQACKPEISCHEQWMEINSRTISPTKTPPRHLSRETSRKELPISISPQNDREDHVRNYSVYKLIDPRGFIVRYVGITHNPEARYKAHVSTRGGRNRAWSQEVRAEGLEPIMEIIETGLSREQAIDKERYWIQYYLAQHAPLTNKAGVHTHSVT